jgi:hypothetical protein
MRRKFAMIATFVVAISGAIATKASPKTLFKTAGCKDLISCAGTGRLCGYMVSSCPITEVQKSN